MISTRLGFVVVVSCIVSTLTTHRTSSNVLDALSRKASFGRILKRILCQGVQIHNYYVIY